jgi:peroxiredoxin
VVLEVALWVGLVAGWLALIVVGALLFQVLRQQGGLLLRIEALEQQRTLPDAPSAAPSGGGRPEGLGVGTELPSFRLPDFGGRGWALDDVDAARLLLVHWSPSCAFCEQIADDLGALQPALRERGAEIVLVSWGNVEENRRFAQRHGIHCPILLLEGSEPVSPFAGLGTPVGYLVEDRRVARPLAFGADEVLDLAHELAGRRRLNGHRPLSESRIERNGLPAGTRAPEFSLPDLDGGAVALSDLRGRRVLLGFSAPECSPCAALAADLQRLHEQHGDELAVVVVSRGDREENRRKRDELGIRYPVVLQEGLRTSRDYGIFETPVAFLIDEDGVIAREVARGGTEIIQLAESTIVRDGRGAQPRQTVLA